MHSLPDNAFDIAACDPPYGKGNDESLVGRVGYFYKHHQKSRQRDMIKINYHIPLVGGVFYKVTEAFNRGVLWHLSRCVKSTMQDTGVLICYE